MTQIKLYLDEDTIDRGLVKALRNADLNVVTVADTGKLGQPDEEQLMWATANQCAIYSRNIVDFCRLHRDFLLDARNHTGIILVFQHYSIGQQLRGLLKLVAEKSASEMINQLVFLRSYIDA